MDSLYTSWLPHHNSDGHDPVANVVNAEWKPPPATSADSSAAVGQSALEVPEFSLTVDLPGTHQKHTLHAIAVVHMLVPLP